MTPEQETRFSGGAGSSGAPESSSGSSTAERESVGTREENQAGGIADIAADAMSQLGNMAEEAGRQAKSVASSLAAEASEQARRIRERPGKCRRRRVGGGGRVLPRSSRLAGPERATTRPTGPRGGRSR